MIYKILGVKLNGDSIITEVEFTLADDKKTVTVVEMTHFRPQSKDEVLASIANRETSEEIKNNAEATNKQILSELEAEIGVISADVIPVNP